MPLGTSAIRGAFLAHVTSTEPKVSCVKSAVDSVRANRTTMDPVAIGAPSDTTTSRNVEVSHIIISITIHFCKKMLLSCAHPSYKQDYVKLIYLFYLFVNLQLILLHLRYTNDSAHQEQFSFQFLTKTVIREFWQSRCALQQVLDRWTTHKKNMPSPHTDLECADDK